MAISNLVMSARTTLVDPALTESTITDLTVNADGRLRVATKPGLFPSATGALTTIAQTLPVDVTDASNVMIHVKNTGTAIMAAGAFSFEVSLDSTNGVDGTWFAIQAVRTNANTIEIATGTLSLAVGAGLAYAWEASVNAVRWMRIRCTTTVTASSIATWTVIRGSYATEPIPAAQISGTQPVSGTVTVNGTVTANQGTLVAGTTYAGVTTASTNAAALKGSAGNLYELSVSNPTATPAFVKFYNKATAPTVGTDVPIMTVSAPASSLQVYQFGAVGKRFSTGIATAVTAAIAATDTGVAVAGIQISGTYI